MMSHSRRTFFAFLGIVMVLATSLWGCQAVDPIKIPLITTAVPVDVAYELPSYVLDSVDPGYFRLNEKHPTMKLTLGGIEYIVKAKTPAKIPDVSQSMPGKLLITPPSPARELTFDLPPMPYDFDANTKPLELTLGNGRKYPLWGWGSSCSCIAPDTDTGEPSLITSGRLWPASVQVGKIGPPPQSTIAIFDSNLDGFYTTSEDGIVIAGSLTDRYHLVQPLSKYISIPPPTNGIFEIRNLAKDGSELTLLPYRGPTASIEVAVPQKYECMIILTSPDAGLTVAVSVEAGKSVAVIPGHYTILVALLFTTISPDAKPQDAMPQLFHISGVGMPALKVKAGEKQTLTLSGPKLLEFQAAMTDGKISIKPDTIHVKGQTGETYVRVDDDGKNPPEVYLNVDGNSSLLGKMEYG